MLSLSNRSFRPVIISNGEFHLNPVFLLNTTQTQVKNSDIYIDKITKLKGLLSYWVEILGGELLLGLYNSILFCLACSPPWLYASLVKKPNSIFF